MSKRTVKESAADSSVKVISCVKKKDPMKETINVAAYCRVSKDIEEQQTSLDNQMASFERIIVEHPGWKLAGIYADPGVTGTNIKNRKEFQRLISDCKEGKIDYILAKSISRFARNTLDMLEYTRMLREMGIPVYFEKERVDTSTVTSEMLLTIYAAFAQEESHSISENQRKSFRQKFSMGIPKWTQTYGFEKMDRNNWVIKEDEAEVIRQIFDLYLKGYTMQEIANYLELDKVTAPMGEQYIWNAAAVHGILTNVKAMGDVKMQLTYVKDHLTHEKVSNRNADIDQYYKENHHDAIVPKETFMKAQLISKMRDSRQGISQYPYYGFLCCPYCGAPMVRIDISRKYGHGWTCGGIGPGETIAERSKCKQFIVMEQYLDSPVLEAIRMLEDKDDIVGREMGRTIREIKKLALERGRVEHYFLDKLVEQITFSAWNVMEITWKNKKVSELRLTYDKAADSPQPSEHWIGEDFFINSMPVDRANIRNVKSALERKAKTRNNTRVIDPDPLDEVQLPRVIKEKEPTDENNENIQ